MNKILLSLILTLSFTGCSKEPEDLVLVTISFSEFSGEEKHELILKNDKNAIRYSSPLQTSNSTVIIELKKNEVVNAYYRVIGSGRFTMTTNNTNYADISNLSEYYTMPTEEYEVGPFLIK
jgi:hypothetical protein